VHPIFRAHATTVFFFDSVSKINQRGGLSSRHLVVCTPGLFLLERRTFPKTLLVRRSIPFFELLLVRLEGNTIDFHGPKMTIPLQSTQAGRIASMVWKLRNTLFSEKPRSAKLFADDRSAFEDSFSYRPASLLADRFLSFAMSMPPSSFVPDEIDEIQDILKTSRRSFSITAKLAASTLIEAVCFAVACDDRIGTLNLAGFNFVAILPHFLKILQFNNSINCLTFSHVHFKGSMKKYVDVWSERTEFSVSEFIFEECDLSSPDFLGFVQAFHNYPSDMAKLTITGCDMSSATLECLCESLTVSPCFRTLTELSVCNIRSGESAHPHFAKLFSSSIGIEQQHLTFVDLSGCALSINDLMPHICKRETLLASVCLKKNDFLSLDGFGVLTDFQRIAELNFSSVAFTGPTLLGMLGTLSHARRAPSRLVLDGLRLTEEDAFYAGVGSVVLGKLEMFSFCNNTISDDQFVQLRAFLVAQPRLIDVGLGGTVESDGQIAELIDMIRAKPFRSLDLHCESGRQPLGPRLLPVLEALQKQTRIRRLDVTGQAVGNPGLALLTALAESHLEDLRCDRCEPASHEFFIATISRLAISCLVACEWPQQDMMKVQATIPAKGQKPIMNQLEVLRQTFEQKLDPKGEGKAERGIFPDILGRSHDFTLAAEPKGGLQRRRSGIFSVTQPTVDEKVLSYRDGFINGALTEIFGSGHVDEPLLVALYKIEQKTSLDAFMTC
jgi:hypothetical protein